MKRRWDFWFDVALAAVMVLNLVLACFDGDVRLILAWTCATVLAAGAIFKELTIELLRDEVKRQTARRTGAPR